MRLAGAIHIPHVDQQWQLRVPPGRSTEAWTVSLQWVRFGGWKVCRIDIERTLEPAFQPFR
jgi:hypothetical protein